MLLRHLEDGKEYGLTPEDIEKMGLEEGEG